MNWYSIFQDILIIGAIISALIGLAGWVSIKFIFKLEKYKDKIVGETPLLKCTNVMYAGSTLAYVFAGILTLIK